MNKNDLKNLYSALLALGIEKDTVNEAIFDRAFLSKEEMTRIAKKCLKAYEYAIKLKYQK